MKFFLSLPNNNAQKQETNKDIETKYMLKDSVYVPAIIPAEKTETVILCLGANVMVEYSIDEARKLLTKNLFLSLEEIGTLGTKRLSR